MLFRSAGLTFIAGIDRFVDMGRTAVNVVGNSIATLVIGESEGALDREKYNAYLDNYGKEKPSTETDVEAE